MGKRSTLPNHTIAAESVDTLCILPVIDAKTDQPELSQFFPDSLNEPTEFHCINGTTDESFNLIIYRSSCCNSEPPCSLESSKCPKCSICSCMIQCDCKQKKPAQADDMICVHAHRLAIYLDSLGCGFKEDCRRMEEELQSSIETNIDLSLYARPTTSSTPVKVARLSTSYTKSPTPNRSFSYGNTPGCGSGTRIAHGSLTLQNGMQVSPVIVKRDHKQPQVYYEPSPDAYCDRSAASKRRAMDLLADMSSPDKTLNASSSSTILAERSPRTSKVLVLPREAKRSFVQAFPKAMATVRSKEGDDYSSPQTKKVKSYSLPVKSLAPSVVGDVVVSKTPKLVVLNKNHSSNETLFPDASELAAKTQKTVFSKFLLHIPLETPAPLPPPRLCLPKATAPPASIAQRKVRRFYRAIPRAVRAKLSKPLSSAVATKSIPTTTITPVRPVPLTTSITKASPEKCSEEVGGVGGSGDIIQEPSATNQKVPYTRKLPLKYTYRISPIKSSTSTPKPDDPSLIVDSSTPTKKEVATESASDDPRGSSPLPPPSSSTISPSLLLNKLMPRRILRRFMVKTNANSSPEANTSSATSSTTSTLPSS